MDYRDRYPSDFMKTYGDIEHTAVVLALFILALAVYILFKSWGLGGDISMQKPTNATLSPATSTLAQ